MKILDRYVVFSFLKNYLISFLVLIGMFIVLDMIFQLDELVSNKDLANAAGLKAAWLFVRFAADYYFYQIPLFFSYLSGIIAVVAAAFTLMRMIRFNELSALLSAGVPLLRVAAPMILVAMALQGLLWVDQELIIPRIIPKLTRSHDEVADASEKFHVVRALRDEKGASLFATRYYSNASPPRMEIVDVVYRDREYRPIAHLRADKATWDPEQGLWRLENGRLDRNISPDVSAEMKSEQVDTFRSSISPMDIALYRSGDFTELLSTATINSMLQRPHSYGTNYLLRVKHTRAAQMVINMILLLLAIATVLTREPHQLKHAAFRCVVFCGSCLGMAFGAHYIAGSPPPGMDTTMWPALMAWLPIFLFGPVAVWLLDRVKT